MRVRRRADVWESEIRRSLPWWLFSGLVRRAQTTDQHPDSSPLAARAQRAPFPVLYPLPVSLCLSLCVPLCANRFLFIFFDHRTCRAWCHVTEYNIKGIAILSL